MFVIFLSLQKAVFDITLQLLRPECSLSNILSGKGNHLWCVWWTCRGWRGCNCVSRAAT